MSSGASTYRHDLYYVQTEAGALTRERVVSRWRWYLYRCQIWRFKRYRFAHVLREKKLDAWMSEASR